MQFSWLETMTKEGQVSPEAREEIYSDCAELLKTAAGDERAMIMQGIQNILGSLGGMVLGGATFMGAEAVSNKLQDWKSRRELEKARKSVVQQFPEYAEKAEARFRELAQVAPSVAMNQNVAKRFIEKRLHEGLSDADVEKLTHIQATYTPNYIRQKSITPAMPKTASAADGELLADLYSLSKEAKLDVARIKDFLKTYGLMAAIPLGVGVGAGGVKELMALRDRKKMESALSSSFNDAMKLSDPTSEPLHENKEKAKQAFQALVHFAPHVAMQPQAARAFMNKIVSYDQGMNIGDIKDLSDIEKNISAARQESPFVSGLVGGTKATGFAQLTQEAVKNFSQNLEEMNP